MTRVRVEFNGRLARAIGITYRMDTFVTIAKPAADITEDDVRLALCEDFENVRLLGWTAVTTVQKEES